MKKHSIIALAAIFGASLLFSCSKETEMTKEENLPADEQEAENPSQENNGDAVMVFSASLEDAVDTKTYITTPEPDGVNEGKYVPKWSSSDKIKVNGVESAAGVRNPDFTTASFSFSEEVKGPFYAIAPSDDNRTWDAENTRFNILVKGTGAPQKYRNYTDGSSDNRGTNPTYDMSHAILAAYSETTSLQFQQLTTYFKLTFTKGTGVGDATKIKTIYVRQGEAADTPNIAGTWRVTFDGSGVASVHPASLTAIIAYNCMVNGSTPTEGVEFGSPVIITLPSYNFSNGLIITVKDTEDHFQSFSIPAASSNLSTKKGTLITKTLTYSPQSGTINNAEEWNAFAAAVNAETNDWDLYKWVGNGTVKIGDDISASDLTAINNLKYTIDGQDHTITRSAATGALIGTISGEVKNLTLAGAIDASENPQLGALADILDAGGKITSVTNEMEITATAVADFAIGGIVCKIKGGEINSCKNNGPITANINVSSETHTLSIGGIVSGTSLTEAVTLKDCENNNAITVTPTVNGNTYYVQYGSLGGIIGAISSQGHKITLTNCDNAVTGIISWQGPHDLGTNADNTKVGKATATSIGGIIGRATPVATKSGTEHLVSTPTGSNGFNIEMTDCDNNGAINGKATGWYGSANVAEFTITTEMKQLHRKVYIGGLAGSILGNSDSYVTISNCTNNGDITPYDYVTTNPPFGSSQAAFSSVVGGFFGWAGYVEVSGGSVGGTIGTKKRHAFSLGGVIGCAIRPFSISDLTVGITGWFVQGKSKSDNKILTTNNYSYFATVPVLFGGTAFSTCLVDITGSTITNCTVTSEKTISATENISVATTSDRSGATFNIKASNPATNWVQGQGYETLATDVTIK